MDVPDNLYFRSDRHFYPFIITFFASLAGLPAFLDPKNPMGIRENQRLPLGGQVHSKFSISTFELLQHFQTEGIETPEITARLCCMLANSCYEVIESRNSLVPEIQFFRHIRNASSHNNRFHFERTQPKHMAAWRTRSIETSLRGVDHPLANTVCFFDYLGPADLVLLLWDIEQLQFAPDAG